MRFLGWLVSMAFGTAFAAAAEPHADFEARFLHVWTLAGDRNDTSMMERLDDLYDLAKIASRKRDTTGLELVVRDAEKTVGLDAGGRSMNGRPVAAPHVTAIRQFKADRAILGEAMRARDRAKVREATDSLRKTLGSEAGLPDYVGRGEIASAPRPDARRLSAIFVGVLRSDPKMLELPTDGKPRPGQPARSYAPTLIGCVGMREVIGRDIPAESAMLQRTIDGSANAILVLQQPEGFFRFPDLRGRHVRYGEVADRVVELDPKAIVDGWLVRADPRGAMLTDAAECGIALLIAGESPKNELWLAAGRRAADWVVSQPCVPEYSRNAESISLLCAAYRTFGDAKYLDAAWDKFAIGVRPGQAESGRWLDVHEARTVLHFQMLRSLHDLTEALPASRTDDREAVRVCTLRAIRPILAEWESVGATTLVRSHAELVRHRKLYPGTRGLLAAIDATASAIVSKCVRGDKYHWIVNLEAIASLR